MIYNPDYFRHTYFLAETLLLQQPGCIRTISVQLETICSANYLSFKHLFPVKTIAKVLTVLNFIKHS